MGFQWCVHAAFQTLFEKIRPEIWKEMKSAYLCRPVLKNEPRSSKDG